MELYNLKYEYTALEPYMSQETLSYHHGKHHAAYVNKGNELLSSNTDLINHPLDALVIESYRMGLAGIFNNAAQHWNHIIFWECMAKEQGEPSKALSSQINRCFGSLDDMKDQIIKAGLAQFGSGWTWLILDDVLKIIKTPNGENPLVHGYNKVLFGIDVWEHSYYIDYRNDRAKYLETFMNHLINWDYVNQKFES